MTDDRHSELPWKASASGRIFAPDHSGGGRASMVQIGVIGGFDDPELVPFNADRWKADQQLIVRSVNCHDELVEALQLARFAVLGYIDRCDYSRGREVLVKMQTALANAGIDTSKWYIPDAALDELRKPVDEVRE